MPFTQAAASDAVDAWTYPRQWVANNLSTANQQNPEYSKPGDTSRAGHGMTKLKAISNCCWFSGGRNCSGHWGLLLSGSDRSARGSGVNAMRGRGSLKRGAGSIQNYRRNKLGPETDMGPGGSTWSPQGRAWGTCSINCRCNAWAAYNPRAVAPGQFRTIEPSAILTGWFARRNLSPSTEQGPPRTWGRHGWFADRNAGPGNSTSGTWRTPKQQDTDHQEIFRGGTEALTVSTT